MANPLDKQEGECNPSPGYTRRPSLRYLLFNHCFTLLAIDESEDVCLHVKYIPCPRSHKGIPANNNTSMCYIECSATSTSGVCTPNTGLQPPPPDSTSGISPKRGRRHGTATFKMFLLAMTSTQVHHVRPFTYPSTHPSTHSPTHDLDHDPHLKVPGTLKRIVCISRKRHANPEARSLLLTYTCTSKRNLIARGPRS